MQSYTFCRCAHVAYHFHLLPCLKSWFRKISWELYPIAMYYRMAACKRTTIDNANDIWNKKDTSNYMQFIFKIITVHHRMKFKESNLRLYWELPPKICQQRDMIAQMWYGTDVWDEVVLAGSKTGRVRRIGCLRYRQNLHHAVASERFGSQNR